MPLRILPLIILVWVLLGVVPTQRVGAALPGSEVFDQAVKAFGSGDYQAALQAFLDARRAGMDTPGLRYNLGVTYYRLQRYPEAESEFRTLSLNPEWAPVANYNLGLTAQRMGLEQLAIERFELAHRTTSDPNLRILAATALERLGRVPVALRTGVVVSFSGGYDTNATLSPDAETIGVSDQEDFLVDALVAATHRLTGTPTRGAYVHGGVVLRKYAELDQYDLLGLRAGSSYETDTGRSRRSVGGYLDLTYFGGEPFEQAALVDLQTRRRLNAGADLRGRYRLGRINGRGEFDYLDGWQHRFTADAGFSLAPASVRVVYELELNNRRDLQRGGEFFSYSPTRHSMLAAATVPNVSGWSTETRGEYRISRYNDPHRLDGGTRVVTREDKRYGLTVRANRRLTARWRVIVDYSYYRNESKLDTYDYGRHQLLAGVETALEK